MFGGINPKQIQGMMKKMGIAQQPIRASKVIFETPEGNLVIDNPDVLKITMQGQETYQITGEAKLEESNAISEEDIKLIKQQTGKSEKEILKALEQTNNDIAEAIMKLKK